MLATNKLMWSVNRFDKDFFFLDEKKYKKWGFFSVIKVMFFYKGKCFIVIKLTFSDKKEKLHLNI